MIEKYDGPKFGKTILVRGMEIELPPGYFLGGDDEAVYLCRADRSIVGSWPYGPRHEPDIHDRAQSDRLMRFACE